MQGRQAVFEVLEMSPKIEKIVLSDPVDSQLWAVAREEGMLTMREDGILKAFDKQIPFSEIGELSTLAELVEEDTPDSVEKPDIPKKEIVEPETQES